ncbi:MAG: dimethylarginine dimethylaminohydrolase family protein [Candidatus Eisenbacteria bacterium]
MFTHAICREPGLDFAAGITTSGLGRPALGKMLEQHRAYVGALRGLGLEVEVLAPLPGFPDAHFVEDAAIVTPEVAVVTRPGAPPRRGEEEAMAPVLARHRPLERITAPGTLEGGDVLIVGRRVLVGTGGRSSADGAAQLDRILEPFGYVTIPVPMAAGLHLKSDVNSLGDDVLLVTIEYASRGELACFRKLVVPAGEGYAANTLWINGTLLHPAGFPETRAKLDALGMPILELDTSESRKMDGSLTCLSLRF